MNQTRWFLALCGVLAAAAAWRSCTGCTNRRNISCWQFTAVLEERNRLARRSHETLIQGCVGVSTLLEAASQAQDVPEPSAISIGRGPKSARPWDEARLAVWNLFRTRRRTAITSCLPYSAAGPPHWPR